MIRAILFLLLMATPAHAFTLYGSATLVPPHNEPVIGDKVARYRLQLEPEGMWKRLEYRGRLTAWGVNDWRTSAEVGHFPESIENSDWAADEWRFSMTNELTLWLLPDRLGIYTEHYQPIDGASWGGHGMERHYYWLIGFRGRIW